jgi:uncharacterized protein YndB with AHSA1/START domain
VSEQPAHAHEIVVRAAPERVWEALTDGELTRRYYYGTRIESEFRPGSRYAYIQPDGSPMLDGEILEIDPPRRLVMTFRPLWRGEDGAREVSRVTFELIPEGDRTRLTMVHDRLDPTSGVGGGWGKILAGLERLLATEPVPA